MSKTRTQRQREQRRTKRIWQSTTVKGMVAYQDQEQKKREERQKEREAEYGWQFVHGDTKIFDETPFLAVVSEN